MAMTLVGVFDNTNEAKEACKKLSQQGIDESMVKVTSTDMPSSQSAAPEPDHRGFFARLFGLDEPDEQSGHYAEAVRRGSAVVTVNLADESKADEVTRTLEQCGAIDTSERVEQWKAGGYQGYNPAAAPYTPEEMADERETFKVMQEELKIGKREVEGGGVRVHSRMTQTPVNEQVTLREEKAVIDRRPVDRSATPAEVEAFGAKDKDLDIRETHEEAVVSKTARVVEEVIVGKEASEHTETINDSVRRTDVDVEQINSGRDMKNDPRNPQPQRPQTPR